MSKQKQHLIELIHSKDQSLIKQGFALLDSLSFSPDERAEVLDFSGKDIVFELESVDLSYANFSNAVIRGYFRSCNLTNCNFTNSWIAVELDSTCTFDAVDCTGAIVTDQTSFADEKSLPTNIQSQIVAFYPVNQLSSAVKSLQDAIGKMGGDWEPKYVEGFLTTPHKIRYYVESLEIASDVSSLSKRHKSRQLDYAVSRLPTFLRTNDVYMSGSFDDEGGYYFDNLCLGSQWTKKHNDYHSEEVCFVIITFEYFYVHFDWEFINNLESVEADEFLLWLYNNSEGFVLPWLDEPDEWIKVAEWTESQRTEFAAFFADNFEVGYCENLSGLREIVSSAYPNSIGGEFEWTSWDTIKSNL